MLQIGFQTYICCRKCKLTKCKIAAATILDCEKLSLFPYYLIDHHHILRYCCVFDLKHICDVENAKFSKSQAGGCHHFELRKTAVFYRLFDQLVLNSFWMLPKHALMCITFLTSEMMLWQNPRGVASRSCDIFPWSPVQWDLVSFRCYAAHKTR